MRRYNLRWRAEHPDYHPGWRLAHRPDEYARTQAWKDAHREEIRAANATYTAQYRKDHPDVCEAAQRRWRARRNGARIGTPYTRAAIWARDGGLCGLCHTPVTEARWHLDHIVPITRGGPDAWENVQVAHIRCNVRKGNRVGDRRGGAGGTHAAGSPVT